MVKLGLCIKNLDISMKEHHFDWTDEITVLQFLIHIVTEATQINMSDGQNYLEFPP